MKVIQATVKFPAGKVFSTPYGEKQNAVVITPDGEEVKIWQLPNGAISRWQKGQTVTIVQTVNGWSVPDDAPRPMSPPQNIAPHFAAVPVIPTNVHETPILNAATTKMPSRETREMMIAFTDFELNQYAYIFHKVCQRPEFQCLQVEAMKDIATTLFIQANRSFNI